MPIILVGHGFGGDTAVNLANTLNTMKNGFRKIDLIVTLDSVGVNNDIIPQNVTRNLNFIGDKDWIVGDAPNIARNTEYTQVINQLVSASHSDIADSIDIQHKIFENINDVLARHQLNIEE